MLKARELIENGFRHNVSIMGDSSFQTKVNKALDLMRIAGYYDFFRTYIRQVKEVDGFTQLRKSDATIWANEYAVENSVDAASLFVQKASQMKEYIEGFIYFGGEAEKRSIIKRIGFLENLRQMTTEGKVREECERLLGLWRESALVY